MGLSKATLAQDKPVLSRPPFVGYWLALTLTGMAHQVQGVAIAWHIYDRTGNPLDLGLIGLAHFVPALLLLPFAGVVADKLSRRVVLIVSTFAMFLATATLAVLVWWQVESVWVYLSWIAAFGAGRACLLPSRHAILPSLVPGERLQNAIVLSTVGLQGATVVGPIIGGILYGISSTIPLCFAGALLLASCALLLFVVRAKNDDGARPPLTWDESIGGMRYILRSPVLLGAITLDFFTMLAGSITALLPIFAKDILLIGSEGMGILRSGPALGAISVGLFLSIIPIRRIGGPALFVATFGIGAATIAFSTSTTLWISFSMLVLIGAFDMVSITMRTILVQIWTPDPLRGRVHAINQIAVTGSNELGGFRAGATAAWVGPTIAATLGGCLIVGVALAWLRFFPQLLHLKDINGGPTSETRSSK